MSGGIRIKESDGVVLFLFHRELDTFMYRIQTFKEFGRWVTWRIVIAPTEAWPARRIGDVAPEIIHIKADVTRDNASTGSGYF